MISVVGLNRAYISFIRASGVFLCALYLLGANVHAAEFTFNAALTIVDPVNLEEVQPLDYGSIIRPDEDVVIAVEPTGEVGTNTTAQVARTPTAGQFTITGSATESITIQATDLGNVPFLQSISMNASYDGAPIGDLLQGSSNLAPPAGGMTLNLGSELAVASNATLGSHTPQYALNIFYE